MNAILTMTRLIIPALVALLVGVLASGPAIAADDDAVLLHCSGVMQNFANERHAWTETVSISRNGAWIKRLGNKIPRVDTTTTKKEVLWYYKDTTFGGEVEKTVFDPEALLLLVYSNKSNLTYSCFPIENPLKF